MMSPDVSGENRRPAGAARAAVLVAVLIATIALLPVPASAQPRTFDALEQEIRTILQPVEGDVAVALRTLGDPGETLLINGRDMFHAASTMKTPVMIELYRQADAGRFALDDSVTVENRFESIVDGSPYSLDPDDDSYDALYDALGETRTVRVLMRAMITASSNLATNLLIEKVGPESVTKTMRRYGADRIQVRRGVEDMKAYRRGLNNQTSAHDLMVILERIARRTAVSEAASREMIDILKQQEHNDMIPARLPDSVEVAHKTGWITGLKHDSAIVFVPGGPDYVLVLLSQNLEDTDAAVKAFARVSRLVYDAVTQYATP